MSRYFLLLATLLALAPSGAFAADMCYLAPDVTQKAVETFKGDQGKGLQLFIKAQQLCPDNGDYAYNLGVAYYRYGRLSEAQQFLEQALVADDRNPAAHNNLAQVFLDRNGDVKTALSHAERASQLAPGLPGVIDTLARALYANGREQKALKGLFEKLSGNADRRLQASYDHLLDRYLAAQIEAVQAGRQDEGLANLGQLDFDPKAQHTRIKVLAQAGRSDEALEAVGEAQRRFPSDSALRKVGDEVAEQVVAGLYADFQNGQVNSAVSRAKQLAGQYPQYAVFGQAFDKLFEAFTNDAVAIDIPKPTARRTAQTSTGAGRTDQLLAGLSVGSVATNSDVDLTIDVDQNIPLGQKPGRYDIAVVIGNRSYENGNVPDVDYAERDARIMREYLSKTMGFNKDLMIYVENAGYAKFNEIFGNERDHRGRLFNSVKPGESRVFVYYVGHGAPDLDSGEPYFIPVDASPQYLKANGYSVQTFYDNLAQLPAKELIVIIDACFSGSTQSGEMLFKGISPAMVKVDRGLTGPDNALVFTSGQADQVSAWYPQKRHSLFSYYFFKGLQGDADANRDRQLTVAEMEVYLGENVPWEARRLKGITQQPQVSGKREQVLAVLR